ncbi:MAG: pyridoxal phosphate-dependent aminotransferase [Eubacteriaceae bacterium]|nr:pyridoxal phosphate-dependent aminotransferase [Eubacteriaceae bacterium]
MSTKHYEFSKRVKGINASPIRKFASHSEKAKKEGKTVIPLNIGQPDVVTPKEYLSAIAAIDSSVIAYTSSNGINEAIDAFRDYFKTLGMPFESEDILITTGGSEALTFAISTLCDDGDEILVFEPYYANYNTLAKISGAKIVAVTTVPENNFALPSYEVIKEKITDRTKAILVTNPNNPTGSVLDRSEIELIVKLALENDLFIIADEVYREFIYADKGYISFTEYPECLENLVVVDSVSKRFSGCGIRIGCVASKNDEFIAEVLKLCQSRLCAPYVEQIGTAAMFKVDHSYIDEAIKSYRDRRDLCIKLMQNIEGTVCQIPDGAFYFILGLPVEDAEDFTGWMLGEFDVDGETIMLCPAKDFYATPGKGLNEVRISYCIAEDRLIKAANILEKGLKEYRKVKGLE